MKKNFFSRISFIALFSIALCTASVSIASPLPDNVDTKVLKQFAGTFKSAENVTWNRINDMYKASFTRDNKRMEVYYNDKDELVATCTYVTLKEIPAAALETITENYAGFRPATALEYRNADGDVNYYVGIENDKKTITLKITSDGETSVFSTKRK